MAYGIVPFCYLRNVFAELPWANSLENIEGLLPFEQKPPYDGSVLIWTDRLPMVGHKAGSSASNQQKGKSLIVFGLKFTDAECFGITGCFLPSHAVIDEHASAY